MDTNQETGVSVADVADLLDDNTEQNVEELEQEAGTEEVAEGDETEGQAEGEGEDESEEVEFEGKAYKVPKEIKLALLRQSDYTQKTQEVAEQRKAVEQLTQVVEQRQRVMLQTFDKAVELREIKNRLSQYEQIDWQSLAATDPTQATQLHIAYQQLQREAQKTNGDLQQVSNQLQQLTETQRQQKLADGTQYLKTHIPDFSEKTAADIASVATKHYGITPAELKAISEDNPDARFVHVLHDAMKWRALQAAKPQAMQKVTQAPKVIKPAATPPKQRTNLAALDRLKKGGRVEDLAAFL
jgi:hypothetical protein